MKNFYLHFIFYLQLIVSVVQAQLIGNYTIGGTSPDYNTVTDAINAVTAQGISGPVVFNIRAGVYTNYTIQNFGYQYPVLFRSESGNPNDVSINLSDLYQCSLLEFRSVTFYPKTNSSYMYNFKGLELAGSYKISFDSCVFRGQNNPQNRNGLTLAPSFGNIFIRNCSFHNLDNAVIFSNTTSYYGTNKHRDTNMVLNCYFDSVQTAIRIGGEIGNWSGDTMSISGNTINKPVNGIWMDGSGDYLNKIAVTRNTIINPSGIGINLTAASNSYYGNIHVANNMVSGGGKISGWTSGPQGTFTFSFLNSIVLNNSPNILVYNNSIIGSISATASNGLVMKNNCIYSDTSLAFVIATTTFSSDYNNIFSDSSNFMAEITSHFYFNLDSLQQMLGQEINSISTYPYYFSNTDLHSYSPFMQYAATPLAIIKNDIDGEIRNNPTPDMGADEYHASPLFPFAYFLHQCLTGNTIQFNNISVRDTVEFWDFGDGNTSAAVSPSHTYSVVGQYTVTLIVSNFFGTDTFQDVVSVTPSISFQQNGDTLSVPAIYQTYQWYFTGNSIPGATNYFYIALFSGNYQIVVTDSSSPCPLASPVTFVSVGINELYNLAAVSVYPNPFTEKAVMKIDGHLADKYQLTIYNMLSEKSVMEKYVHEGENDLERETLQRGMYFFTLTIEEGKIVSRGTIVIQ